jgi:hypothetical protein
MEIMEASTGLSRFFTGHHSKEVFVDGKERLGVAGGEQGAFSGNSCKLYFNGILKNA